MTISRMIGIAGLCCGIVLGGSALALAQTQIKNPRGLAFTSPDHAQATGYEVDIVRAADSVAVQTLSVPVTSPDLSVLPSGEIQILVNVMPIQFGDYRWVVRTVAGALKSVNSDPSDVWQRAPNRTGKPRSVE